MSRARTLDKRVADLETAQMARITMVTDTLTREQLATALCLPPTVFVSAGDALVALAVIRGERPGPAEHAALYAAAAEGGRAWLEDRPHPTHAYVVPTAAARGVRWLRTGDPEGPGSMSDTGGGR